MPLRTILDKNASAYHTLSEFPYVPNQHHTPTIAKIYCSLALTSLLLYSTARYNTQSIRKHIFSMFFINDTSYPLPNDRTIMTTIIFGNIWDPPLGCPEHTLIPPIPF